MPRLPQQSKKLWLLFSPPLPLSSESRLSQGVCRAAFRSQLHHCSESKVEKSGWQAGNWQEPFRNESWRQHFEEKSLCLWIPASFWHLRNSAGPRLILGLDPTAVGASKTLFHPKTASHTTRGIFKLHFKGCCFFFNYTLAESS